MVSDSLRVAYSDIYTQTQAQSHVIRSFLLFCLVVVGNMIDTTTGRMVFVAVFVVVVYLR